jgi:hypothetical protein
MFRIPYISTSFPQLYESASEKQLNWFKGVLIAATIAFPTTTVGVLLTRDAARQKEPRPALEETVRATPTPDSDLLLLIPGFGVPLLTGYFLLDIASHQGWKRVVRKKLEIDRYRAENGLPLLAESYAHAMQKRRERRQRQQYRARYGVLPPQPSGLYTAGHQPEKNVTLLPQGADDSPQSLSDLD